MPVRSLNSSVFKWPDHATVDKAVRSWAQAEAKRHPELQRLGYFGSYARGDWGVGSDLDLVAVVDVDEAQLRNVGEEVGAERLRDYRDLIGKWMP